MIHLAQNHGVIRLPEGTPPDSGTHREINVSC